MRGNVNPKEHNPLSLREEIALRMLAAAFPQLLGKAEWYDGNIEFEGINEREVKVALNEAYIVAALFIEAREL